MPAAEKRQPAVPRPSASLIILSPSSSASSSGLSDYRVCLIQRHMKMQVSGGAIVFPGGNLAKADTEAAEKLSAKDVRDTALRICALREAFEECGVLAGLPSDSGIAVERLAEWRKEVYEHPETFLSLYDKVSQAAGQKYQMPIGELVHWSKWVTPVVAPKRFDTDFYLYILPRNASAGQPKYVSLAADGSETERAAWATPQEAIDAVIRDHTAYMLPPQLYLLAELANLPTINAVKEHAKSRRVMSIEPVMVVPPGSSPSNRVLAYAGDEYYPNKSLAGPKGARHRAYVAAEKDKDGRIRPVQPMQVVGVFRRNVEGFDNMLAGAVPDDAAKEHAAKAKL